MAVVATAMNDEKYTSHTKRRTNISTTTSATVPIYGLETIQHGRRILVGKIAAQDLALLYEQGVIKTDEFAANNEDGYQRSLVKSRSRRFARFISKQEGISPTALLLYVRNPDTFPASTLGHAVKYAIPTETANDGLPLMYIADGQHRTAGFAEAIREGWMPNHNDDPFDVPVTILFWDPSRQGYPDPRFEEASQFFTINQEQRRMRTDLAQQYLFRRLQYTKGPISDNTPLTRMKRNDYKPYKVAVARRLNTDPDSPLKNLISMPNTKTGLVTEGSFTDSITPIMSYAIEAGLNVGQVIKLLKTFWKALLTVCPNAMYPDQSMLLKTTGIYTVHTVLPSLFLRRNNLSNQPTVEQMLTVLQEADDCFTDAFWDPKGGEAATFGGGQKAFRALADRILDTFQSR